MLVSGVEVGDSFHEGQQANVEKQTDEDAQGAEVVVRISREQHQELSYEFFRWRNSLIGAENYPWRSVFHSPFPSVSSSFSVV